MEQWFDFIFVAILLYGSREDIRNHNLSKETIWVFWALGIVKLFWGDGRGTVLAFWGGLLPLLFFFLLLWVFPSSFGGGDVKWMMAGGVFLGLEKIVLALSLGFLFLAPWAIFHFLRGNRKKELPMIPFLSLGIFISWIWGERIWMWYLN